MIRGSLVTLRPAREADRRAVYEWLAQSDVTASMMGPPLFPDAQVPTWDEFCADYSPLFFDGSRLDVGRSYLIEREGEAIGHVNYQVEDQTRAELDIWMRSSKECGHGYGSDALAALTGHLHETMGLSEFLIRPSARNPRAIRAYTKAGFVLRSIGLEQQTALYGAPDQADCVVLVKRIGTG